MRCDDRCRLEKWLCIRFCVTLFRQPGGLLEARHDPTGWDWLPRSCADLHCLAQDKANGADRHSLVPTTYWRPQGVVYYPPPLLLLQLLFEPSIRVRNCCHVESALFCEPINDKGVISKASAGGNRRNERGLL